MSCRPGTRRPSLPRPGPPSAESPMPYDGKRLIFGGFEVVVDA
ncbi:hypothetical protein ACR80S_10340 [Halomonas sp. MA07-2]